MKRTLSTIAAIIAAIIASSIIASAMSPGEFFARDEAQNWTGQLYYQSPPAPRSRHARPARVRTDRRVYMAMVEREARRQGVPVRLALALTRQESGFNPRARSRQGAMGMMQIMPGTWRSQGCTGSPWSPEANVRCGMSYLAKHYRAGGARWAALRYHGGPNVRMHGRKTKHYARVVLAGAGIVERHSWAGQLRNRDTRPMLVAWRR